MNIPNPIKDLTSSVCLDVVASCHHDQAESETKDHDSEAMRTTPDVKDFRKWELNETANQASHDAGCCRQ